MIRRGDNDVTDGILDYLAGLFSHDIDRMDRYSNIKGDTDAVEEVKNMGGFGKALADRVRAEARSEALDEGRAEGRKEGRKEGRAEVIIEMLKNGKTPEAIADFCGFPLSFILEIQKKMQTTVAV